MAYAIDMSEADRIKEEIGWLKNYLVALVAIGLLLLGWLAQNYDEVSPLQAIIALITMLAITIGVAWVNRLAYVRIERLEKL